MTSCAADDSGTRCSTRPALPALHPRRRDDDAVAVNFRPRQLRGLVEPQPGEQQHPVERADRVLHPPGGPPEREQFSVGEAAAARLRLADDLLDLQPVARRHGQAVDVLVDAPVEKPPDEDQQARAICGALRFLRLMTSSTSSVVMSPNGRSRHAVTKAARKSRSAILPRRSCASLSAMKASAALPKECRMRSRPLTRCLRDGFGLDHGRVDALVDQASAIRRRCAALARA